MTEEEKHNVLVELKSQEWTNSKVLKFYSYVVLICILFAQVSQFWTSRIISPAFQYPIDGLTPEQAQYFSIRPIVGAGFANLVGTAFVIPLIIGSIFSGMIAANFNRAAIMCGGVIIWSGAIVGSGFANNLLTLIGLRVVLGLIQGLFVPVATSLIIDYFPVSYRTSAFAIISIGQSLGIAFVSLTTNLITLSGWRMTFWQVGGFFLGFGVLSSFIVREPLRGIYTFKTKPIETVP